MNADAIKILLDHHVHGSREPALRHLESMQPHHEASESEVEIAWRFRHERPEIAAKWFSPQPLEDVPFAEVRARLRDPVALWYQAEKADETAEDELSMPRRGNDSGPLRERLLHWARTTWKNPPPAEPLRIARKIDAREVPEALAENPHLLPMLLTFESRDDRLDEPGLLFGEDLLLAWSALNPTPLLGRLVATASLTDIILTESHRSLQAAALRNPRVGKSMASSRKTFDTLVAKLQPALAIAWTRFRNHTSAKPDKVGSR
jgi:hypothetical protein